MITPVSNTISNLKNLWIEIFQNKTNKATNVADGSIVNAIAFATAKIAQKAIKDIAIVETQIFPTSATGDYLDKSAALFGVSPRKGALGSSTYVRIYAEPGTVYGTNLTFINKNGIRFEVDSPLKIDDSGYGYVSVRSTIVGSETNVDANSIVQVTPRPLNHIECTNEYRATGGRDREDDEIFRIRILNNNNKLSQTTIEYWNQLFQDLDSRVLKVLNVGLGEDAKIYIYLVTQNGSLFTDEELEILLEKATPYFALTDIDISGNAIGVVLKNAEWMYVGGSVGMDFRVEFSSEYDIATIRKNIQVALTKYLDFRFWSPGKIVQYDDLLQVVKTATGVKYVPDEYFNPSYDQEIPLNQLPRIKGFVMRGLNGSVLYDSGSIFSNLFYPAGEMNIEQGTPSQVFSQKQTVFFVVNTNRGASVDGATISIGRLIIVTDANGRASVELENGEYSYVLSKPNWTEQTGSFIVLDAYVNIVINDFFAVQYNVDFTVTKDLISEEGVTIKISNQTLITDVNGKATIKLEPNTYVYTLSKIGYTTIDNVCIVERSDLKIDEHIFLKPQEVYVAVIDTKNEIFVPTANVWIQNQSRDTDQEGQTSFEFVAGSYALTVLKEGYSPYEKIIDVSAIEENKILVNLSPMTYNVLFTILDQTTNSPISGAILNINGTNYQSNSQGLISISLSSGTYNYVVSKVNLSSVSGTLIVNEGATGAIVRMTVAYWKTTFIIKDVDNGKFINGVFVVIGGITLFTDINGKAVFSLQNGTYPYVLTNVNYRTTVGEIIVEDEEIHTIFMQEKQSKVAFDIKDLRTSVILTGATVVLKKKETGVIIGEATSNSLGIALFDDVDQGDYLYVVSKNMYNEVLGEVTVEKKVDININILMSLSPRDIPFRVNILDASVTIPTGASGALIKTVDQYTGQTQEFYTDITGKAILSLTFSTYDLIYSYYDQIIEEVLTIGPSQDSIELQIDAVSPVSMKFCYKRTDYLIAPVTKFIASSEGKRLYGEVSEIKNVKVFLEKTYKIGNHQSSHFSHHEESHVWNDVSEIKKIEVRPIMPSLRFFISRGDIYLKTKLLEFFKTKTNEYFKANYRLLRYNYVMTIQANAYHPFITTKGSRTQNDEVLVINSTFPIYSDIEVDIKSPGFLDYNEMMTVFLSPSDICDFNIEVKIVPY